MKMRIFKHTDYGRYITTLVLMYFVYAESGIITAIAIFLLYVGSEAGVIQKRLDIKLEE